MPPKGRKEDVVKELQHCALTLCLAGMNTNTITYISANDTSVNANYEYMTLKC